MHGHIHAIDTLSYLLGDPAIESVRGELQPRDIQIENDRLDEDPFATFEVAFAAAAVGLAVPAGNWEYEVLGSEGSVRSLNNGRGMIRRRASGPTLHLGPYAGTRRRPVPAGASTSSRTCRRLRVGQTFPGQR